MPREVYKGNYVRLTEEVIDGDLYERVFSRDAVIIYAMDEHGKFLMIREKRPHEPQKVRLKPVTGFIDDGDDWQTSAQKELREEVGLRAERLQLIHHLPHRGTLNTDRYFVLATGLSEDPLPNPDGDVILEVLKYDLQDLVDLTLNNTITITFDSVGIFLLENRIRNGALCLD